MNDQIEIKKLRWIKIKKILITILFLGLNYLIKFIKDKKMYN